MKKLGCIGLALVALTLTGCNHSSSGKSSPSPTTTASDPFGIKSDVKHINGDLDP
jgi:hypothetical protein